ncbi:hypothetical protein BGX21_009607 [Mortierella sp. AD011]|nr:hypothetical protein BGX21_009607 [Mortierella sp. AD011]
MEFIKGFRKDFTLDSMDRQTMVDYPSQQGLGAILAPLKADVTIGKSWGDSDVGIARTVGEYARDPNVHRRSPTANDLKPSSSVFGAYVRLKSKAYAKVDDKSAQINRLKNKKKDGGNSGDDNEEVKAKGTRNVSDRVRAKLALGKLYLARSLPVGSLKDSILLVHGIVMDAQL